jgi:hypothetical protein
MKVKFSMVYDLPEGMELGPLAALMQEQLRSMGFQNVEVVRV